MWFLESTCSVCHSRANGICKACVAGLEPGGPPPLLGIEAATVLCSYEGVGAELIRAIKYQNRRQGLGALVEALSAALSPNFDALVAVPAHPRRLRERGYHVPDLLAAGISKSLKIPVLSPLTRVDDGSQRLRDRSERKGVEFRATSMVPSRILLVDDVVTTGATAVACSVALGLAGGRHIELVALGSTPLAPASQHSLTEEQIS